MSRRGTRQILRSGVLFPLLSSVGCVLLIREPEFYEEDAVEMIEGSQEQLRSCYDEALVAEQLTIEARAREAQGPYGDIGPAVTEEIGKAEGTVIVRFEIAKQTGELSGARVDETRTTAPSKLSECVVDSLTGLRLADPDHHDGDITLAWKFEVGKPSGSRPDQPPDAS